MRISVSIGRGIIDVDVDVPPAVVTALFCPVLSLVTVTQSPTRLKRTKLGMEMHRAAQFASGERQAQPAQCPSFVTVVLPTKNAANASSRIISFHGDVLIT